MTDHVPQPMLCAACETMARANAEQAQPNQMIPYICEHNFVVALGYTRGNTIVTWNTLGPLSPEAAKAAIARMLADAKRLGMPFNTTRAKQ